MKWFHHECAARHDPKLQILGEAHGAEGLGIYWCLLEELGHHSDSFCLQILDAPLRPHPRLPAGGARTSKTSQISQASQIPRIPMKILARNLFTTPRKLISVITTCVDVRLFDAPKWNKQGILYSPSFEHRADDYTRRVQRRTNTVRTSSANAPDSVRTSSEHSPNTLRTKSADVPLDTEQKKKRRDTEQTKHTSAVDNQLSENTHVEGDSKFLIVPSEDQFDHYCLEFHSILQHWNATTRSRIDWHPSMSELKKLFCEGSYENKLTMCFHAYKILNEHVNYPELVLRALRLMLKSATTKPIDNPVGWLWTCLHGNTNGTHPWAQLLTSDEESH
jgi:hypothetical protein